MISAAQSRAARALLDMSQAVLAAAAGIGISTVADVEGERREVSQEKRAAIEAALVKAGVIFIPSDEAGGEGVRLAGRRRRGR